MREKTEFACPPYRETILQLFHKVQAQNKASQHISSHNIHTVSHFLGISPAEVEGVLSFYHLFSRKPRSRYIIRLCDSLSCRISKSLTIYKHLKESLEITQNQTTKDGLFTLEIVNCLGSCDTAPNMMINSTLYTHLTTEKIDEIIGTYRDLHKDNEEAAYE